VTESEEDRCRYECEEYFFHISKREYEIKINSRQNDVLFKCFLIYFFSFHRFGGAGTKGLGFGFFA
jgi:hypothetical protein